MPKQIVILDPNGVEVANRTALTLKAYRGMLALVLEDLEEALWLDQKLGTYTVTVKEVE